MNNTIVFSTICKVLEIKKLEFFSAQDVELKYLMNNNKYGMKWGYSICPLSRAYSKNKSKNMLITNCI